MGTFQGRSDFERALRALDRRLKTRTIPAAIAEGLDRIRRGVRAAAPIGKTNELRDQVDVSRVEERGDAISGAVTLHADHAAAVDLGTHDQKRNQFIERTLERDGQRITDDIARRIARDLDH